MLQILADLAYFVKPTMDYCNIVHFHGIHHSFQDSALQNQLYTVPMETNIKWEIPR